MIDVILIILEQLLISFPLIYGAYISVSLMKVPDLSLESAYVFGAILASKTLIATTHLHPLLSLILTLFASLCGGAAVGLTSSVLTQKARFPHLLSTIITFGLFHGLDQLIARSYISLSSHPNLLIFGTFMPRHPELTALLIICTLLSLIIIALHKTQLFHAYAVYGGNRHFLAVYGISTSYVFITGIMIGNALAGMAGYLSAQTNGLVEFNMGTGKALLFLTALILGKACMKIARPISLFPALMGSALYFTLQQLLLKIGFNLTYFTMVQAVITLLALVIVYKYSDHHSIEHLGV